MRKDSLANKPKKLSSHASLLLNNLKGKPYVLYHFPCFDGFGAAWAAHQLFKDSAEYIPVNYGLLPPEIPDDAAVFILDYSFPRDFLISLHKRCRSVVLLDHHKPVQKILEGLDFAHFDISKSGAVLSWEYFFGTDAPEFLQYIQDRDLWKFELPQSEEIAAALRSYPFDFDTWTSLASPVGMDALRSEGEIILKHSRQMVNENCKKARMVTFEGYQCPIVNSSSYLSEVGMRLLALYPESLITIFWFVDEKGIFRYSLRSREDGPDVAALAVRHGGNGHPHASGFTKTFDYFDGRS